MSSSEEKSSSEAEEVEEKPVESAEKKKNKMKSNKKQKANAPPLKKAKVESPKTPAIAPKDSSDESDSDGSGDANVPEGTILDLGRDCHARVNDFKGKVYLDFRAYYTPKGSSEMRPGNKGISFTPEQWAVLKKNIPVLDKALQKATKN